MRKNKIELEVDEDGNIMLNDVTNPIDLLKLREKLRELGIDFRHNFWCG